MSDHVVEPSEIFVEPPNPARENKTHVNPWIRFLARFFDYSLFFLLLLVSRKWFHGHLPFGRYEHYVPFEFFVWIPIEAFFLSTFGATPGKFFLKTRLRQGKKEKLDFITALRRSFSVWFRGLGLGIPVLNVFCFLFAFNRLKLMQITTWDRDDHIVVTHYPIGRWRIYVAVFVAAVGILYYYSEKNIELQNAHKLSVRFVRPVDEHLVSASSSTRFHFST